VKNKIKDMIISQIDATDTCGYFAHYCMQLQCQKSAVDLTRRILQILDNIINSIRNEK